MAKSRKRRKNYKLRKRVMRTVSALTMIMAVTVAAIPVERYGTMEAAADENGLDYVTDINSAGNLYDNTNENLYKDNSASNVTVQRLNDNILTDAYTAHRETENSTSAAVGKNLLPDNERQFDFRTEEYYNYVYFDIEFVKKLHEKFDNTDVKVTFSKESGTSYTIGASEIPSGIGDANKTITLEKINTTNPVAADAVGSELTKASGTIESGTATYNKYDLSSNSSLKIYQECMTDVLGEHIDSINAYNSEIDEYKAKLAAIQSKDELSADDITDWNYAVELAKRAANLTTLSKKYSELRGSSGDSLSDIDKYILNKGFRNKDKNNHTLANYEIVDCTLRKKDAEDAGIYVPKLNKEGGQDSGQYVDSNGYLADGKISNVKGIKTNAFKNSHLESVSMPSSFEFIGTSAFEGSTGLRTVSIDDGNLTQIGDSAFKDCDVLTSVNFTASTSKLGKLGKEAFANTSLAEITFPVSITDIGFGCFKNSDLGTVTFNSSTSRSEVKIGGYAFYDCDKLSKVIFPTDVVYDIGNAAFSIESNIDGSLTEFTFPPANTKINGDHILAGRRELTKVIWPAKLKEKIPANTLRGCNELEIAVFPHGATDSTGSASYDEDILFKDVTNPNFYVEGPAYQDSGNKNYAKPRSTTWKAHSSSSTKEDGSPIGIIPYMYEDEDGKHFEIGYGENYIARLDVIENSDEAVLAKYFENPDNKPAVPKENISVEIPDKVGDYTVVEIAKGCFDENGLKDRISELIIKDASIRTIDADAFSGCSSLQWVEIGDAVTFIGSNAFANCPKLENVVFSQTRTSTFYSDDENETNESYWEELVLEDNAFNTQSDHLTFHGAINENYAPYALAMSENSANMTKSKSQICYVTDAPLNLTVIRDRETGLATLIDYPHYEEIDVINKEFLAEQQDKYKTQVASGYSFTDKFEEINEIKTKKKYTKLDTMDEEEDKIVLQTLNLKLPSGIESIDAKGFFTNSDNSSDFDYLEQTYTATRTEGVKGSGTVTYARATNKARNINKVGSSFEKAVRKLYSSYESESKDDKTVAGLFSGFFEESTLDSSGISLITSATVTKQDGIIWKTYKNHKYNENNKRGNDYLTTVNMNTVKNLPDYAFESAENLMELSVGSALETVGELPFRDAKSLWNINTNGNKKYSFDNMLFYENQGDEVNVDNKIIQCLEGRGMGNTEDGGRYGTVSIGKENDPMLATVSSIAPYAFSNCDNIHTVDLSTTKVTDILEGTFDDDDKLTSVTLPESVDRVEKYAFRGSSNELKIVVNNPNCVISNEAFGTADDFKGKHVVLEGSPYLDETTKERSPLYNSWNNLVNKYGDGNVEFTAVGSSYVVSFFDNEGNLIKSQIVTSEIDDDGNIVGANVEEPPKAPDKTGYVFTDWYCILGKGDNTKVLTGEDAYKNITEDRIIIAQYKSDPSKVAGDGQSYDLTVVDGRAMIDGTLVSQFPVKVESGKDGILLIADEENFSSWTTNPSSDIALVNPTTEFSASFTMPEHPIIVTANHGTNSSDNPGGSGSDNPGGSGSGDSDNPGGGSGSGDNDNKTKYKLTVNYGSGSGEYEAGTSVTISAYAPESSSRVFSRWTSNNSSLGFASATSATTTLVMPEADVTVTANYKARVDDDDEDDDDTSRRPNTNTTTTVTNPSSNSGSNGSNTSGTVTNNNNNNNNNNGGSKIYITKNGVSNKDLASVSVSGSTDNFIVRISETDEATAAAEEALINRYGSLDGLVYFPMDISLYDSTGQNKITDTYGLNITITMPIPDVLIQYGGNSRVAATDNGTLQALNPVKFTTIDGIACISFVPPHFSPYVIYVDTKNLTAGQTLDSTPTTGDPIHPKWFLAIGMACVSVILFAASDGRKRKKYRTA